MTEFIKVKEMEIKYKGRSKASQNISSPEDVWKFFKPILAGKTQEHFAVLYMNNKNHIHGWQIISIGTVSEALVHPREVFKGALLCNASAIICVHNHPSGILTASKEDIKNTERIVEAGKIIGIPMLDHVIVTEESYMSMKEEGCIQ